MADIQYVADYAALTALTGGTGLTNGGVYFTRCRATADDGGAGEWRYDATSSAAANGGTVLAISGGGAGRFFRLCEGPDVYLQWFATGDGSTNDRDAVAAACALGARVIGDQSKIYYMFSGVEPSAGCVLVNGRFKAKMGSGGFNRTSPALDTTSIMFHWNDVDGGGIENCEFFGDGASEKMLMALRVNLGMSAAPFACRGHNYFHDIVSFWRGAINIVSLGAAGFENLGVLSGKNIGTSQPADGAYWSGVSFVQCTFISVDEGIDANDWSERVHLGIVEGTNVWNTGQAFASHGGQGDVVNFVGGGTRQLRDFSFAAIYADGTDEPLDCLVEGLKGGLIDVRNSRFCAAKFAHGAQNNVIDHVNLRGAIAGAGVVFAGSATAAHDTAYNIVRSLTGEGIGEYKLLTGTLASATSTSAVLPVGASTFDDFYRPDQACIRLLTGTGAAATTDVMITDYIAATRTITVASWPAGTPSSDTAFEILPLPNRAAVSFQGDSTRIVTNNVVEGIAVRDLGALTTIVRSNVATGRDNQAFIARDFGYVTAPVQEGYPQSVRVRLCEQDKPLVRAYRTGSNQSISDSTDTTVIFNAATIDNRGELNTATGVFTATIPGRYTVSANIRFPSLNNTDVPLFVRIRQNGSTVAEARQFCDTGLATMVIDDILELSIGDSVAIQVEQQDGINRDILAGSDKTWMNIELIC
ncbi:MAG TPA: hypothetical protein VGO52_16585 [Hyphomonadaceae bacterium]|jgi:hypothetical protein|nr:hypothetical protein [Hyphomonadaceae bacterium]